MQSTNNERKSVAADKFIRTLKNKIYNCMTPALKNVYIDKLVDIVYKYNNTYLTTVKMKPVGVKLSKNIYFNKENNGKDPKSKNIEI